LKNLTTRQAQVACASIARALGFSPFAATGGEPHVYHQDGSSWPNEPVLVKDFECWAGTVRWAVVWEGGPHDWASELQFSDDLPSGWLFVEAYNGWALALYPAV